MTRAGWCAVACLVGGLSIAACGDDGGVEVCTGTCITVSNLSTLIVEEVNYTACGEVGWGDNRLGSGEILPGEQRSWSVAAGCFDIQAVAVSEDEGFCGRAEYGVDIAEGTTHVLEYQGCPTATGG